MPDPGEILKPEHVALMLYVSVSERLLILCLKKGAASTPHVRVPGEIHKPDYISS